MLRTRRTQDSDRHLRKGKVGRRRVAFLLGGSLLAALVLSGVALQVIGLAMSVRSRFGALQVGATGQALAIRREEVLPAIRNGVVHREARDGSRVAKGTLLARVVVGEDQAQLAAKTAEVDERLHEARNRGILGSQRQTQSRTLVVGLQEQRKNLDRLSQQSDQVVAANAGGTVSFAFDGLEGVLNEQGFDTLLNSRTDLADIARRAKLSEVRDGEVITAGSPVAKLVDNFQFWLVIAIDAKLPVAVGDRVRVRVWSDHAPGEVICPGTVLRVVSADTGKRLLVSVDEYWPFFNRLRAANAEVITREYRGVIVPKRAVTTRHGQTGVFVLLWRGTVFQPVTVRGERGSLAVVDGVPAGVRVRGVAGR